MNPIALRIATEQGVPMADVFISYSRQDKEFVAQLREALLAQNQEVWIDWESILPSQAWWSEIQKGIARANNFVVVLSPQSMASPICHMEVEYARQLKKRIIPVLLAAYDREESIVGITKRLATSDQETTRELWGTRQLDDIYDANDTDLKSINYFFFKSTDDFQSRFDELFTVINTDYEHKETHTTLQLRATEWDRRNCDTSFLLLDTELADAQAWLAASADKEPPPTDLHRAYIEASTKRTRQLRNIRRTSIAGSIAAVLATVFAIVASLVGVNATARINDANATLTPIARQIEQGQALSRSLQYAAAANAVLQDKQADPRLAVLLSVRGLRDAYSPQSDTALQHALDANEQVRRFEGHTYAINSTAFSPDGRSVLTGGCDEYNDSLACIRGSVRLWDTETGKEIRRFEGHTDSVYAVAFSADGRFVLTGSGDKTVRLWDTATGVELRNFEGHSGTISSVAFSADGRYILTGSWDNTARLWDIRTDKRLRRFEGHTDAVYAVAFSPDGHLVLTGSGDKTARLWDTTTGTELRNFEGHTDFVNAVAFSPDGRFILTGSWDKTARLWGTATGKELRRFEGHIKDVESVAFSPDGRFVLTGGCGERTNSLACIRGSVWLWDTQTGTELRNFEGHTDAVNAVAFSPDGRFVLTGSSSDKTARLWDTSTGAELRRFGDHADAVSAVAFSLDGRYILTGSSDKTVRLWDTETGKELRRFEGHTDAVNAVAFSPDGHLVLTGSGDKTVRLWDTETGKELRRFEGHATAVFDVAFSPDGRYILTGSQDKTARLWDSDYFDFVNFACTRVYRDFTDEERRQYSITDSDPTCPQFADTEHLVLTPFPPTTTPLPITLPAWTPIASPTVSPTFRPSPTLSPTPMPTYPLVMFTLMPLPTDNK